MAWVDSVARYVIRRIREDDRDRAFITSYEDFDTYEFASDRGTLRDYWRKDQASARPMPAFILIDCPPTGDDRDGSVIGVLRYRYEDQTPTVDELMPGDGPYLYFSRVGIAADRQRSRLGKLLVEFFFHLVMAEMQRARLGRLVVWWKCIDRSLTLIRSLSDTGEVSIFAIKWSEKWSREYYVKLEVNMDW